MDTVDISSLDLGSIDFTPDWAKKEAAVVVGKTNQERDYSDRKKFDQKRAPSERKPGDRKTPYKKPFERRESVHEKITPLSIDIKILPDPKALGTIIRKLQQDCHAYKLKDLAYFFLDNLASVLLKITPKKDENAICEVVSTLSEPPTEQLLILEPSAVPVVALK